MEPMIIKVWKGGRSQPVFHRVTHTPFTIGRAYDNDLIVADDTVSPYQLRITQGEKGYMVEDMGSENGSWVRNAVIGHQPELLGENAQIEIGRTHLALFSADTPVSPTHPYKRSSAFTETCSRFPVALGLLVIYLALALYDIWPALSLTNDWKQLLMNRLPMFVLPLFAALLTGLLGRILVHRWRYWLQISIASSALIFIMLLEMTGEFLSYFLTSHSAIHMTVLLPGTLGFILLLRWQLGAVSTMKHRNTAYTSVSVVLAIILIAELRTIVNHEEFSQQPQMHTRLNRLDLRADAAETSIDEYMAALRADLEGAVQEELQTARER